MRSKRLQEALKNQRQSTVTKRQEALQNQRSSTTKPCSGVDDRLNAVANMLDAGSDSADEDTDVQILEDQWLPPNSDSDADILDADGNSDIQIVDNQSVSADSDEDANILDANVNGDIQIMEDQSLPTSSEKVSGSSRKRKCYKARKQVTDVCCEPNSTRKLIIFDKYGRPCDSGSEQFATDIGKIVRANCPPAIDDWRVVPVSMKENLWKNIIAKYVIAEVYKPNILSRARTSWKKWKSMLRTEMDKHETIAEKKINMPERLIRKREDWESFVDFCNTDEDRKRRAIGKKAREAMEFVQACGRKGIYRKIYDLEKENPTGEVNRCAIFLDTHVSKTINDPDSSSISDIKMRLIKEYVEANPDGQKDIDNDAVTLICGRDSRGIVRGMGGGVSITKVRASAAIVETLREVQQENKSLQSNFQLLNAQFGKRTQSHTSIPSNQSASDTQVCTSTPSNQSASQAAGASNLAARSCLAPPDMPDLPARSHLAPPASNSPARSCLVPPPPNSPAHSRLASLTSNLPAISGLGPVASNLPASSCFIKNFKGRTIALGSFNTADPPMEYVFSLIIEDIFDRDAELFDKDGKLGDIMIGGVINWPKACVESNLPADSCFIRNFKRRTIAFGSFNAADPDMEHVYSVIIKEIYDRDAELFDTDGKLGDIMVGGVINWPKACIKPCRQ